MVVPNWGSTDAVQRQKWILNRSCNVSSWERGIFSFHDITPLKWAKALAELLPRNSMNSLTKVKDCCKNGNAQPCPNILRWGYWQCLRDMALGGCRLRAVAGAGTTIETIIYGGGGI